MFDNLTEMEKRVLAKLGQEDESAFNPWVDLNKWIAEERLSRFRVKRAIVSLQLHELVVSGGLSIALTHLSRNIAHLLAHEA